MESKNPDSHPSLLVDTNQHQPLKLAELYPVKKRSKKLLIVMLLGLIILLGGIYVLSNENKKKSITQNKSNNISQTTVVPAKKDVNDITETKIFENGFLGIKLTIPVSWNSTETENNGVRIESPEFRYKTLTKGEVMGNFRINIRMSARVQDSKYIGRGYATQPSENLIYSKPALGQRANTFLTKFGLDTPDNFAYFLIAGNYNLTKGDTLGPDYGKEPDTYIISGGFSSKDLTDDFATNQVSIDFTKTSNAYKQAVDILKTLQLH